MKLFRKLHPRRSPPGLEWTLLRRLPRWLLGGTVICGLLAARYRIWPGDLAGEALTRQIHTFDIFAIALVITLWTAAFTVAIGCLIVHVMKGPAYVADAYELPDPDKDPREAREEENSGDDQLGP